MKIEILKALDNSICTQIKKSLNKYDNSYLGISYANYNAFRLLKNDFNFFLRKNGKLRVLFDIEKFITDREIIEEFSTIPGDSECKVFIKSSQIENKNHIRNYHPKFYLFFNENDYNVIIGSSNFTFGGLKKNIECNVSITGKKDDLLFNNFEKYFFEIWNLEFAINILSHSNLLDEYFNIYHKHRYEDKKKNSKLFELKKKLDENANLIINSKKKIFNEKFLYLLGLISANSKIDFKKKKITIELQRGIFNRGKNYEGFFFVPEVSNYKISQFDAHNKDLSRIIEQINELINDLGTNDKVESKHIKGFNFQVILKLEADSPIFKELLKYNISIERNKTIPFVPKEIINSKNNNLISAFIKGYCDLKSRFSASDGIYKTIDKKRKFSSLRMGISIPRKHPELLPKFKKMFKIIGVTKGISFTNPEVRNRREHLIRIDVRNIPYELIGTHWRRIFLHDFINYLNKKDSK